MHRCWISYIRPEQLQRIGQDLSPHATYSSYCCLVWKSDASHALPRPELHLVLSGVVMLSTLLFAVSSQSSALDQLSHLRPCLSLISRSPVLNYIFSLAPRLNRQIINLSVMGLSVYKKLKIHRKSYMVIYGNIKLIESAIEVYGNMQVIRRPYYVWFHASYTLFHSMAIAWKSMCKFY